MAAGSVVHQTAMRELLGDALALSHGLALNLDGIGVVDDPVTDGIGQGGVVQVLVPLTGIIPPLSPLSPCVWRYGGNGGILLFTTEINVPVVFVLLSKEIPASSRLDFILLSLLLSTLGLVGKSRERGLMP